MSTGLVNSIPIVRINNHHHHGSNRELNLEIKKTPNGFNHHSSKNVDLNSIDHYRRRSFCQQVQSSMNNLPRTLFTSNSICNLSLSDFISLSTANGLNRISSKLSLNPINNGNGNGNGLLSTTHNSMLSASRSENNLDRLHLYERRNNSLICSSTLALELTPQKPDQPADASPPSPLGSVWSRLRRRLSMSVQTRQSWRRRNTRLLHFMRVFLTQIFSTTGLCFLVVLYTCFGAFVFTFLELPNENRQRLSMQRQRLQLATDLWNYTAKLNVIYPDQWSQIAMERIQSFEDQIVQAVQKDGYGSTPEQWSFSGALLYSVTVVTTIGYGNVTCKTNLGRIATILYAIIGIPITFLCLANLGNLMAEAFRFSYRQICCCFFDCCRSGPNKLHRKQSRLNRSRSTSTSSKRIRRQKSTTFRNKSSLRSKSSQPNSPPMSAPSMSGENPVILVCSDENEKFRYDDEHEPIVQQQSEELLNVNRNPSSAMSFVSISPNVHTSQPKTEIVSNQQLIKSWNQLELLRDQDAVEDIEDFSEDERHPDDEDKGRVPIWLVFCLVVGYILLGAFMFSIWEGWGPVEGAYFCFTTLTTIGFGDLVPGSAKFSHHKDGQTKFVICCIYMMVGLSLIAMSINLVQEEIVIKARRIARRLGLIKDRNLKKSSIMQEEEEDEEEEVEDGDQHDENQIYVNQLVHSPL